MIKVLIVEDSVFSQKITAKLIKEIMNNVEIFFANNGQEGYEKYKEIKPDYILLDLLMPKLNGIEVIKLIKEDDKDAKIIVISADIQKEVREEIDEYNIMLFLNKPFNKEKAQLVCSMMGNDDNA